MPSVMPRWLWFVCVVVVPCGVCVLLDRVLKLQWPSWAWFLVGGFVSRVGTALWEIWEELREAMNEATEERFHPWFKPFWRLMKVAGLIRSPPGSETSAARY
jgi:hypothetical protein